jgi:hypothetical protein
LIHFKEKKKLVKLIIHLVCDENQLSRAHKHHPPMLTTTLAFDEWTEIPDSERLTGGCLTDSRTGATSWKRMGKVIDCERPGKDLHRKPTQNRIQTREKLRNKKTNLTGHLKPKNL